MEYMSGGSLMDLIEKIYVSGNRMDTINVSRIIKLILKAVNYLHEHNIIHRDLKPGNNLHIIENIMFAKKNDINSLKLIDFGLSTKQNEEDTEAATGKCGTAIYMAPEVFSENKYSKVNNITN